MNQEEAALLQRKVCPLCDHGAKRYDLRCWQCDLVFHVHWEGGPDGKGLSAVPEGAHFRMPCPDLTCQAVNAWVMRHWEPVTPEAGAPEWWGYVH